MDEQEDDSGIPAALSIFMGIAAGVAIFLVVAVLLRSLILTIVLVFLLAMPALGIWQHKRLASFTAWLIAHPNTTATLKRSSSTIARSLAFVLSSLLRIVVVVCRTLLWIVMLPFLALRNAASVRNRERRRSAADESRLDLWKQAETREVTRPRDARTKYCLNNIGREVQIRYRGTQRDIRVLRVFMKPDYHKTYVEAEENGEVKTFNIDDITLVKGS